MRRKALPLLLAATLALGGYAAFQRVASKESRARKTDSIEGPAHMEGEKSMYKETTENVIYLAGGCFWGMEQLMQSIPGGYCHIPKAEMELFSKLRIDPGDSHLGHVFTNDPESPTACVTASTVCLCALYRTRRCNPRATGISSTCSMSRFSQVTY